MGVLSLEKTAFLLLHSGYEPLTMYLPNHCLLLHGGEGVWEKKEKQKCILHPFPPIYAAMHFNFSIFHAGFILKRTRQRQEKSLRGSRRRRTKKKHGVILFCLLDEGEEEKEFGTCGPPFSIHTREREKSFLLPRIILLSLRCHDDVGDGSAPSLPKCTLCTVSFFLLDGSERMFPCRHALHLCLALSQLKCTHSILVSAKVLYVNYGISHLLLLWVYARPL